MAPTGRSPTRSSNLAEELHNAARSCLWLADGPLAIRFDDTAGTNPLRSVVFGEAELAAPAEEFLAALGGDIAEYWRDVAAPRHPFVRSALSGLRG